MSTAGRVVPFSPAPIKLPRGPSELVAVPGLSAQAVQGLEGTYPGTLTAEMRSLLRESCGLTAPELGTIDFTGRWHPEEPITVLRPCLTLAIDDEGRRWIAETSRERGLPGPVWCVLPDPAVSLHVSEDLNGLIRMLNGVTERGQLYGWLRAMERDARGIWGRRHALARLSYENCRDDAALRGWLAEMPFDAHIYDLRAPQVVRGWPYGLAGPEGRFYRCGRLPIFAVCAAPSASRWTRHMSKMATTTEIVGPAVARRLAA